MTFSHDWQSSSSNPHSKAYIQFSSDGQAGEIKFQIRYYGTYYNSSSLTFYFFTRTLRGKHNNTFNHLLFNVKETEYDDEFLFFEDLDLNNNKITNLAEPKDNGDAITKKYFENKAVLLNRDNSMKANIDMNGRRIFDLPNPTGPSQPATKSFLENKIKDYVKKRWYDSHDR